MELAAIGGCCSQTAQAGKSLPRETCKAWHEGPQHKTFLVERSSDGVRERTRTEELKTTRRTALVQPGNAEHCQDDSGVLSSQGSKSFEAGGLGHLDPCPGNQTWHTHPPKPLPDGLGNVFNCLARFQVSGRGPLSLAGTWPQLGQVLAILKRTLAPAPPQPLPPSSAQS